MEHEDHQRVADAGRGRYAEKAEAAAGDVAAVDDEGGAGDEDEPEHAERFAEHPARDAGDLVRRLRHVRPFDVACSPVDPRMSDCHFRFNLPGCETYESCGLESQ